MKMHEIWGTCPICHKNSHIILTEQEFDAYIDYLSEGHEPIQKMLPRTEADARDFLRTENPENRYCAECMAAMSGNAPSGRIRPNIVGLLDIFENEDFDSLEDYYKFEGKMSQVLQSVTHLTPKQFRRRGIEIRKEMRAA